MVQLTFPTGIDVSTKSIAFYSALDGGRKFALSNTTDLMKLTREIAEILSQVRTGTLVAIDWSPLEAFWGDRRSMQRKSLIVGIVSALLISQKVVVLWVSAQMVRKALHLRANAKKREVHDYVRSLKIELSEDEDIADAQILSLIVSKFAEDVCLESSS